MTDLIKSDSKAFSDEVSSWIKGVMLLNNIAVEGDQSRLPILKITPEKGKPLEIALIALNDWFNNPGCETALRHYHRKQQDLRNDHINSIILWEDVWLNKKDIVKSRILSLLGKSETIPARLTQVRRIDKKLASEFLERNHMQGNPSSKYRYGLFLPNQYFRVLPDGFSMAATEMPEVLVAVATFSAPRIFSKQGMPHRSYELIRFANLLDITVVGGFDKLIKYFINDIEPDDIMTYADLEWSDGRSYQKLGFEYISDKEPIEILLDTTTLNRTTSNKDISQADSALKVLNAGSRKFVKTVKRNNII